MIFRVTKSFFLTKLYSASSEPSVSWDKSWASVSILVESRFSKNLANKFRENLHPRSLVTLNNLAKSLPLIINQVIADHSRLPLARILLGHCIARIALVSW